jgi:hypothetical protein
MAFQTVDASARTTGRSKNTAAQVSFYGKTSQFRLNAAAMELLGNPAKLEVQYDQDTNRIAFVPSEAAYAVALRSDSETAGSRYFGFKSLANLAGLSADARFALPLVADAESGYLVINLSDAAQLPAPAPRQRRNKATAETQPEAAAA